MAENDDWATAERAGVGYFLREIEFFTLMMCQPYPASWFSAFLSLARYTPLLITLTLYIGGWRYGELYLLLFAIGLTGDGILNFTVNYFAPGTPRLAGCLPVYGSTLAYQVQHASFFVTFVLGYVSLYRPRRATALQLFLLFGFYAWVVAGAHFLNYHTAASVLAGAAVGTLGAYVYQSLLHWFVVPHSRWIVSTLPARYFEYQDTLTANYPRIPLDEEQKRN